jgi:hypothetical protein
VIYAQVHKDESGQPHLYYGFVPVTRDENPNHETDFKICKKAYVNRKDLFNFHQDLQDHLNETFVDKPIIPQVQTGITAAQGGNRTVRELKSEREQGYGYGVKQEHTYDINRAG